MGHSLHLLLTYCSLLGFTVGTYSIFCPINPPCSCTWNSLDKDSSPHRHAIECSSKDVRQLGYLPTQHDLDVYKANFSNNFLAEFPSDAITHTGIGRTLEILDLSDNYITHLENIPRMDNLTHLLLGDNLLNSSTLQNRPFRHLSSLQYLDLPLNRLGHLPDLAFSGLNSLTQLTLKNCLLVGIAQNSFSNLTQLVSLNLERNILYTLPPGTFNELVNLKELHLSQNRFTKLTFEMFGNLPVYTLDVAFNGISQIDNDTFEGMGSTLVTLDLDYNYLDPLSNEMFQPLYKLKALQLKNNGINVLPSGFLHNSTELRMLDLSLNRLTSQSIPKNFFQHFRYLSDVYLSFNLLTEVPDIHGLPNLRLLALDKNEIHTLWPCQFKDQLASGETFDLWLLNTSLHCDCKLRWLSHWLQNGLDEFADSAVAVAAGFGDWYSTCKTPERLSGKIIRELQEEELVCEGDEEAEYCPEEHNAEPELHVFVNNHTASSITVSWRLALHNEGQAVNAVEITWFAEQAGDQNHTINTTSTAEQVFTISGLTYGSAYTICITAFSTVHKVSYDVATACLENIRTKIGTIAEAQNEAHGRVTDSWVTTTTIVLSVVCLCIAITLIVFLVVRHHKRRPQRAQGQGLDNPMFDLPCEEIDTDASARDMQDCSYDVPYVAEIDGTEQDSTL